MPCASRHGTVSSVARRDCPHGSVPALVASAGSGLALPLPHSEGVAVVVQCAVWPRGQGPRALRRSVDRGDHLVWRGSLSGKPLLGRARAWGERPKRTVMAGRPAGSLGRVKTFPRPPANNPTTRPLGRRSACRTAPHAGGDALPANLQGPPPPASPLRRPAGRAERLGGTGNGTKDCCCIQVIQRGQGQI
jgi:hypothetical protein